MDSEPAEGNAESPFYGEDCRGNAGSPTAAKVALAKAQEVQSSSLCNQFPDMGREHGKVAHGTVVDEEGEPHPRTSFTYRGGTVAGVLCSLIVQATAVTQVVLCRKGTC